MKKLLSFILLLVLLNFASALVVFKIKRSTNSVSRAVDAAKVVNDIYNSQNCYRARHQVAALSVNNSAVQYAQNWANEMASNDNFQHSSNNIYGENLFYSSPSGSLSDGSVVTALFYSESKNYNYNSNSDQNAGHFTQMVWKVSTSCGAAVASSQNADYVAVEYYPPGNYINQYTSNVFPPINSNPCSTTTEVPNDVQMGIL